MNDNLLIAAVLREVADVIGNVYRSHYRAETVLEVSIYKLRERAAELDPPEKNEDQKK